MKKFALNRKHRISLNREMDLIFQAKQRVQNKFLTLCWTDRVDRRENLAEQNCEKIQHSRFAIKISSKVANAVVRNRLKRILREIFRIEKSSLKPGIDLLVMVRSMQYFQSIRYSVLHENFMTLCKQAKIWKWDE